MSENSITMRATLSEEARMRGDGIEPQPHMWSYVPLEQRIPADHPLRPLRAMVDAIMHDLSAQFDQLYSKVGRPSIPPEHLLRALLLQVLYSVRSERLLMEQLDYNLLFRWFVGLAMDDPIWDATVFTKNRERLLRGDIARAFFERARAQAEQRGRSENVTDSLVQRDAGAERKDEQRNDEAPEIELATVAQRVELVGWLRRPVESIQQENLVAGVDERMNRLARHRRAAGEAARHELRQRDEDVAQQGRVEDAFRGAAGYIPARSRTGARRSPSR
jgi:transposase